MRTLVAAAALAALAACATTAKFEENLNSFLGSTEDNLVSQWGPPDSTYELGSGKVLTYRRGRTAYLPGQTTAYTNVYGNQAFTTVNSTPGINLNFSCTVNWTLDSDGVIRRWNWQGNDCKAR